MNDRKRPGADVLFRALIEAQERLKLTPRGREAVREDGARQTAVLVEVIQSVEPYRAIVERAAHREEAALTALDVAAHWHDHYSAEVSESDRILKDQAVCFFQIAAGAGLGELIIGRRGSSTRFQFDRTSLLAFIDGEDPAPQPSEDKGQRDGTGDSVEKPADAPTTPELGQG